MYAGKTGFMQKDKQITYEQFVTNIEYAIITGTDTQKDAEMKRIRDKQRDYHEKKFNLSKYDGNELHACIVAPSYKNVANYRYAWHIESILQQ